MFSQEISDLIEVEQDYEHQPASKAKDEEVYDAGSAILRFTHPNYRITRNNKEIELSEEELRSCLLEWALSYKQRQYELDKKKGMNKK